MPWLHWRAIHMLRHACGYKLANDTRAIQDWLGHRSIQHRVLCIGRENAPTCESGKMDWALRCRTIRS